MGPQKAQARSSGDRKAGQPVPQRSRAQVGRKGQWSRSEQGQGQRQRRPTLRSVFPKRWQCLLCSRQRQDCHGQSLHEGLIHRGAGMPCPGQLLARGSPGKSRAKLLPAPSATWFFYGDNFKYFHVCPRTGEFRSFIEQCWGKSSYPCG